MERRYDIVTFDCYGTLVDWDAGIAGAFLEAAAADGVRLEPAAVLAAHADLEPRVQQADYRSYRRVLEEVARRVAARLGWRLPPERAAFLADSLPRWAPFPDTNPALERLAAAGYALGILSNVDDDLLAATLRQLHVEFELVVTAEGVRSYKPAPGHFLEARRRVGARRWLHAAQSHYHDVTPAVELGIPVAWINRTAAQPVGPARADHEFSDLARLADWLCPTADQTRPG